eukprot:352057-Chlamydomonas_euryale.AAC.5
MTTTTVATKSNGGGFLCAAVEWLALLHTGVLMLGRLPVTLTLILYRMCRLENGRQHWPSTQVTCNVPRYVGGQPWQETHAWCLSCQACKQCGRGTAFGAEVLAPRLEWKRTSGYARGREKGMAREVRLRQ